MEDNIVLSLRNISVVYPGVKALDDLSIDFRRGAIHALVGENGAGKSTLIKVIAGAIRPDGGTVTVDGASFSGFTPAEAASHGIQAIYQEFNLVGALSVAENICLGEDYGRLVDFKRMNRIASEVFERFHIPIDPRTPVQSLSNAHRQIVEIAKAVSKKARIMIFDEPTAPLTVVEVDILMGIIRQLREEGVTILYISHRLDEIFEICDRVSVLRDGKYVGTRNVAETNRQELIRMMVGREISESGARRKTEPGAEALKVVNLTGNGVKNISFTLRHGEILGVGGLVGAGRTEIMKVLYGAEKKQWGHVWIEGKEVEFRNTGEAMRSGLGLVPEDRKNQGCFLRNSIRWNTVISCLKRITRGGVLSRAAEKEIAERFRKRFNIRTPSIEQLVINLSGGNQQKVALAKAMAAESSILILDEPTRGVDVGAKQEIYDLMNDLCDEGKCIIMISSDMEELLSMSDRIIVLYEGEQTGEIAREEFSQEYVLFLASGGTPGEYHPLAAVGADASSE